MPSCMADKRCTQGQGSAGARNPLFDSSGGQLDASSNQPSSEGQDQQQVNSSSSSGLLSFIGRGLGWGARS